MISSLLREAGLVADYTRDSYPLSFISILNVTGTFELVVDSKFKKELLVMSFPEASIVCRLPFFCQFTLKSCIFSCVSVKNLGISSLIWLLYNEEIYKVCLSYSDFWIVVKGDLFFASIALWAALTKVHTCFGALCVSLAGLSNCEERIRESSFPLLAGS